MSLYLSCVFYPLVGSDCSAAGEGFSYRLFQGKMKYLNCFIIEVVQILHQFIHSAANSCGSVLKFIQVAEVLNSNLVSPFPGKVELLVTKRYCLNHCAGVMQWES